MTLPGWWSEGTISDVAEVIRGVTYSKADTLTSEGNDAVPLLRATNLEPGKIDYDDMVYIPKSGVKPQQFLQVGDVFLAASSGSISVVGKSAQVKFSNGETFGAFCAVIRPKTVNPKFLGLWVQTPFVRDLWSSAAKGTNINNLKSSDLLETKIPLPSLPEQERIVEILEDHLSRLDAALADVKQAKLKAAKFRSRFIQELLSRELLESIGVNKSEYTERLRDYFDFQSGFAYKSAEWIESGVPVVKIMNVKNRLVNLEGCSFISTETAKSTVAFAVSKGDLLFNMTGATLGVFGFYESDSESRMNQRVGKFIPKSENPSNLKYLAYFLESFETQVAVANLAKGAAQPNISPTDILSIPIHMPNPSEQLRISSYLDANLSHVSQTTLITRQIELQANALRRSLLQAAFTGQLTKKEVNV
jgi:type I restriction enzyme S subunit